MNVTKTLAKILQGHLSCREQDNMICLRYQLVCTNNYFELGQESDKKPVGLMNEKIMTNVQMDILTLLKGAVCYLPKSFGHSGSFLIL